MQKNHHTGNHVQNFSTDDYLEMQQWSAVGVVVPINTTNITFPDELTLLNFLLTGDDACFLLSKSLYA